MANWCGGVCSKLTGGLILVGLLSYTSVTLAQVSLPAVATDGDSEARIDAALARRVSIKFVDTPLRDAVEKVGDRTGITIRLSKKIEDVGVQPDQPVTVAAENLSAEAFLSLLLRDLNLTFMVKNGVLLVTTIEDAQSPDNTTTRVYPVADLIDRVRIPAREGGGIQFDFDPIIEMITSTVEPDSWQDVGGPGSITGFENSRCLVVSTRRDLHQRIAGVIQTLRQAKGAQGIHSSFNQAASSTTPARLSAPLPVPERGKAASYYSLPPKHRAPTAPVGGGGLF